MYHSLKPFHDNVNMIDIKAILLKMLTSLANFRMNFMSQETLFINNFI